MRIVFSSLLLNKRQHCLAPLLVTRFRKMNSIYAELRFKNMVVNETMMYINKDDAGIACNQPEIIIDIIYLSVQRFC